MADEKPDARDAIIQLIIHTAEETTKRDAQQGAKASVALRLAEAYAWVTMPGQPHGGGNAAPA